MESNQISASSVKLIRKLLLPKRDLGVSHSPTVYTMAGIPGSGKSTFVKKMIANGVFPAYTFILNPDNVMENLPEYKTELLNSDKIEAFRQWELPARELAYQLLEEVIESGKDIIIDMGLARPESYALLKRLKVSENYVIKMYWLEVPIKIALDRLKKRDRYTPVSMVYERMDALKNLKPKYQKLVTEFYDINNNLI